MAVCARAVGFGWSTFFPVVCVVVFIDGGATEETFDVIVNRFFDGSLSGFFLFVFAPVLPGVVEVIAPPELPTFISPPALSSLLPFSGSSSSPGPPPGSPPPSTSPSTGSPASASGLSCCDDAEAPGGLDGSASSSGPAHATPGTPAITAPIPNATANAPTRPTYSADLIALPPVRCGPRSVATHLNLSTPSSVVVAACGA